MTRELTREVSGLDAPTFQSVPREVERATVERAQAGDHSALADLYDWYMPRVYRYVLARLGNIPEAEDLTEEIFLRMLGAISGFRFRESPFSSWLFRIAHNQVISYFRKVQRNGQEAELSEHTVDVRHDVAAMVERQMTLEDVRRAAALLPEAQREVIALRFAVGLTISETAKALGKNEGNIKQLQHKAVAKLQKALIPGRKRGDAVPRT